ncbi:MAG: phosphate acyltransferase PlsX [Anaerolineales bacterium]|jgi:glycerol-3-phosphate acyltransferase PlsX
MRIVLDAMGSDDHPEPELQAAAEIADRWPEPLLLAGPQDVLQPRLDADGITPDRVRVIHAPEVLKMTDKPARAARGKAKSSMAVGMQLIKEGDADAFVTAGNTGGALANALFILGRIRGVKRPPLAALVPVQGGHIVALDIGANADCKPEYLAQFAVLGSVYAETALGKQNPRVGLLSNGEEPGKGNTLIKETFPLLESADINFLGNVEPKEAFGGTVDVVVMDGFTGNVFIKASESVAGFLINMIRDEIQASPLTTIGGLLARPAFRGVRKMLDPAETGAAPLLGIKGLVFVGHGRSDARALVNAVRITRQAVEHDLLNALQQAIQTRLARNKTEGET